MNNAIVDQWIVWSRCLFICNFTTRNSTAVMCIFSPYPYTSSQSVNFYPTSSSLKNKIGGQLCTSVLQLSICFYVYYVYFLIFKRFGNAQVIKEEGLSRGLYRGNLAMVLREAPGNMAWFSTYYFLCNVRYYPRHMMNEFQNSTCCMQLSTYEIMLALTFDVLFPKPDRVPISYHFIYCM